MKDNWFGLLEDSLRTLDCNDFSTFSVDSGKFTTCIYYPKNSNFNRFKEAFYRININNIFTDYSIYCLTAYYKKNLPPPPWRYKDLNSKNQINGLEPHQYVQYDLDRQQLIAIDLNYKFGLFLVERCELIPDYEYHSPLRSFFHFFALAKKMVLLHAASLFDPNQNKGAIVLGKGGRGKSTTVISALKIGLTSCGDDYILVCTESLNIVCLYRTIKWEPATFMNEPAFLKKTRSSINNKNHKIIYTLPRDQKMLCSSHAVSQALIVKKGVKDDLPVTCLKPHALLEASLSTITQQPIHSHLTLALIKKLILKLSCFYFTTGRNEHELDNSIRRFTKMALVTT